MWENTLRWYSTGVVYTPCPSTVVQRTTAVLSFWSIRDVVNGEAHNSLRDIHCWDAFQASQQWDVSGVSSLFKTLSCQEGHRSTLGGEQSRCRRNHYPWQLRHEHAASLPAALSFLGKTILLHEGQTPYILSRAIPFCSQTCHYGTHAPR